MRAHNPDDLLFHAAPPPAPAGLPGRLGPAAGLPGRLGGLAMPLLRRAHGARVPAARRGLCHAEIAGACATAAAPLPGRIRLDTAIPWPVRNQQPRGTCVAFGVVACLEYPAYRDGLPPEPLSEQLLYWAAKQESEAQEPDDEQLWLRDALAAVAKYGVCAERLCRYRQEEAPPVWGARPSDAAFADAKRRAFPKPSRYFDLERTGAPPRGWGAEVLAALAEGKPVALCLPVLKPAAQEPPSPNTWDSLWAPTRGLVADPGPDWVVASGHCVTVLGFEPDPRAPGGGWLLFRNSWGSGFAAQAPTALEPRVPQAGWGLVSLGQVDQHAWELASF